MPDLCTFFNCSDPSLRILSISDEGSFAGRRVQLYSGGGLAVSMTQGRLTWDP